MPPAADPSAPAGPPAGSPASTGTLHATILLRRDSIGRAGAERMAVLRAVRATGSIRGAAQAAGLSYKAAWDAVQVLNNLFDRPLVTASAGGAQGGAATVTPAGIAVIAGYEQVEAELGHAMRRLEASLGSAKELGLQSFLWGAAMRTSARNALRGTISRVTEGAVNAEVALTIAEGIEIVATITLPSVAALGLAPGVPALALVKASFVILAREDEAMRTSARNRLAGTVIAREDGAVNSEVTLEIGAGKTLTATLTCESARALDLTVGTRALAMVKASHVILAVD